MRFSAHFRGCGEAGAERSPGSQEDVVAEPQSNLLYRRTVPSADISCYRILPTWKRHALFHSTAQSHQPLAVGAAPISGACTAPSNLVEQAEPGPTPELLSQGSGREPRAHRFNKKPGRIMLQMD